MQIAEQIEPLMNKAARDVLKASATLSDAEARYLVDSYYQMQSNRIRSENQIRSMENEPHEVLKWLMGNSRLLEEEIKKALNYYSMGKEIGRWMRDIKGIGPVIAAGMLAHIDITRAETAGKIWRYAGLDPSVKWEKGKKRPWNASLKVLCWKLGESFVKVSGKDDAIYGKLYLQRKDREIKKNDNGDFKDQAEVGLKRVGKSTEAYKHYKKGKLPPGQIHARAKRWAVKIFLSHLHERWFEIHHGKKPPKPYPIAILGHSHLIEATVGESI